jgi:threonine dehydratase
LYHSRKDGWTVTHTLPTEADIAAARVRLKDVAHKTPLEYSQTFSDLAGHPLYLKLEMFQKTGSFKLRGAYNKIANLPPEARARGVIAASAGNHAQGVAYAAARYGVPCTIVMPETASLAKIAATQHYGARVVLRGDTYDDAYAHAKELQEQHGYTFVHAFDDPHVIAGQGTIALEVMEDLPDVETFVVPVGGGGLIAGIAAAVKRTHPQVRVVGVEAARAACFRSSLEQGGIVTLPTASTIADGIAVKRPGDLTFAAVQEWVDDIVTVEEEEIARTMVLLLERSNIVSEFPPPTALAAVLYGRLSGSPGRTAVILSGGNVDVTVLSRMIEHGLVEAGRYLRLKVTIADRPGALRDLLDVIAKLGANVVTVQHHRIGARISIGETEVELDLETRDRQHIARILETLRMSGYKPLPSDE